MKSVSFQAVSRKCILILDVSQVWATETVSQAETYSSAATLIYFILAPGV